MRATSTAAVDMTLLTLRRSPSSWRAFLSELSRRREVAAADAGRLKAERAAIALKAQLGDTVALERLAELTAQATASVFIIEDLDAAIGGAERRLHDAEAAEDAERMEKRRGEAAELAEERVAAAEEVDKAFAALDAAMARYQSAGAILSGYVDAHGVSAGLILSEYRITLALAYGAERFARVITAAPTIPAQRRALAGMEREIFSRLLEPRGGRAA